MQDIDFNKPQWVGYSKGVAYPVFRIREDDPKIGLCEVEGWRFLVWCTFEKIIKNTHNK